ncbi:MAG: HEAT repeat domain-containing protein [Candidatus Caldatribacteriaceae bacterium]
MVNALKQLRDSAMPEKVAVLFCSQDLFLRNAAVAILASQWQTPLEVLARSLKSEDKHVRKLALDALHALNTPIAVDIIATALEDSDVNNVIAAVEYIAERGGYRYGERIARILASARDPFLVATCLEALGKIGDRYTAQMVRELFPELGTLPEYLLPSYLRFVAGQGDREYLPLIAEIAKRHGQIFYKEILDALRAFMQRREDGLTVEDREAIGSILQVMLTSDIPSPNRYEILFLLAQVDREGAFATVHAFLYSTDPLLRLAALETIGEHEMRESLPEVRRLVETEEDEDVRQCALDVLERLGVRE